MELIKKKIYLYPYVSRHSSLIPFMVEDGDTLQMTDYAIDTSTFPDGGNWGKIPYDIDIKRCDIFFDQYRQMDINPQNLLNFFISDRVSFNELAHKYSVLKNVMEEAQYYKAVVKNNTPKWVAYTPNLREKFNIPIYDVLPENYVGRCGIYKDNTFEENGSNDMLSFLLKAMGIFVVRDSYINEENGVPDIMYYMGVPYYREQMNKYRDSENCCKNKEYEFLGGETFYHYLGIRESEIKDEILYWFKALYRGEYDRLEIPFINMPVALNADFKNIGSFTCVPDSVDNEPSPKTNCYFREITIDSYLKYLRLSKITFCEENGVEVELPFILDEREENGNTIYELIQPYQIGYLKNLTINNGVYYGDMIYRMDYIEETEGEGVVNIYYVIGGKLKKVDNKWEWEYADSFTKEDEVINFLDFLSNPNDSSYKWSVENYLYIKNELSKVENYPDGVVFRGDITSYDMEIPSQSEADGTWVYRITYTGKIKVKNSSHNCYYGDYVIIYNNNKFLLNSEKISGSPFSGIRFFEQKTWKQHSYAKMTNPPLIYILTNEYSTPQNIFTLNVIVNNDDVKLVDYSNLFNDINGVFYGNEARDNIARNNVIMMDHNFGKIDMYIENASDVIIDRGFVSSFEMLYKLGEINTMEDMENYGNNFFGF